MALNIIDFSNGIRPEEIQDNFDILQEQISRERLSVGGSGIASGLNITPVVNDDAFYIEISDGSIIDDNGDEVFIKGKAIQVAPPILYQYKEYVTLSEDRTVVLKHIPYASNRRRPAEELVSFEPENSGIIIKYRNSINQDDYIRVRNIVDRTVTVTGAALSRQLEVTYNYTSKRIDTLYLDQDLQIKIKEGTTSSSPSAILPIDAKYLIAYLEINHEFQNEADASPHAYVYVKDDLKEIRNLYTSEDGTLYICGVPFDDLQIIHLKEPVNPKPNALWLNVADNSLYCWRSTNEFIYKNKIDITTDFANDSADAIFSTYMDFLKDEEELSVYLNNNKLYLGRDYEEVTIDIPTYGGNDGSLVKGNGFRILATLNRTDSESKTLLDGDVLTYIIKYKDSHYTWVPINKMNYITAKNTKVYSTYYDGISDDYIYEVDKGGTKKAYFDSALANSMDPQEIPVGYYPYKYQYFLFHRVEDLNMHFTPGRKELSILINQMPLHEDQFKEITVFDLIEQTLPSSVLTTAAERLGWSNDYIENTFNGEYDSSGIGFMLLEPLDSGRLADEQGVDYTSPYGSNDIFVEAIVERRICATPINRRLERSATFVHESHVIVNEDIRTNKVIDIAPAKYRYDEHQLEVFVDGMKQVEGVDYIEEFGYFDEGITGTEDDIIILPIDDSEYTDQDFFIRKKSAICTKFKFVDSKSLSEGSVIEYKITTNVYSYDHINNILDDIGDTLTECKETITDSVDFIKRVEENIEVKMEQIDLQMKEIATEKGNYLTETSILNIGQMPEVVINNLIKSLEHINTSIRLQADQMTYSLEDIWPEDYVNIVCHSAVNGFDSFWVNGLHYRIVALGSSSSYLEILSTDYFMGGEVLYISGIKLSGNNRDL